MGKIGEVVNQFITPLLFASNAAVFVSSFAFIVLGGWLLGAKEEAAVGTAAAVFAVGILLMFCSSMGLLGMLRKSWKVLAIVVVVLSALMIALFGIMTVAFVLGYQMPSIRDIVASSWTKGCADPAHDRTGCLQAETVANNWCWTHGGIAVPGMFNADEKDPLCAVDFDLNAATSEEAQKKHACSVSCKAAMVAVLEDTMSWVSLGCYIAFATLLVVVLWNSQTHHGLWCFVSPSDNEDDDDNTVMSISPMMAYIAYFLNGCLALLGLCVAVMAAALLESPTSVSALFAVLLGAFYFIVGAVCCVCVAKDLHMILRICNILYVISCLPLLILSLVAAVYSGRIENVYDFYDRNWCRVRGELDIVTPTYCEGMSDAVCKKKIVDETADNLAMVAWIILITLGAIACLIWFSTRLARKFRFDDREFDDNVEYADDEDDKGGDDDDGTSIVQLVLMAAPWVVGLIAIITIYAMADAAVESPDCSLASARVDFNGTGLIGYAAFTQTFTKAEGAFDGSLTGLTMDVEYTFDTDTYTATPATRYEIHEFPVPESGDCSDVGGIFPSDAAGTYTVRHTDATATDTFESGALQVDADGEGLESLFYDGVTPVPLDNAAGTGPAVQLFGTQAIQGRSFVIRAQATCAGDTATCSALATEDDCSAQAACTWVSEEPACGTISYSGDEWETMANFTAAQGVLVDKIRGAVVFSQVTTRGSESDTTIYIELEATAEWDETTDGTPEQNGCSSNNGDFASCGHKMHIHESKLSTAGTCDSAEGHFNIAAGKPAMEEGDLVYTCSAGADGSPERAADCETGDITGKFSPQGLKIGKPGKPAKYFFVDTFDKQHSIQLKGSGVDVGDRSVVLHAKSLGADRMACADVPIAYPWESLTSLG